MLVKVKAKLSWENQESFHTVNLPRKQVLLEALESYRDKLHQSQEPVNDVTNLAKLKILDSMIASEKKRLKGKKNAKAKSN